VLPILTILGFLVLAEFQSFTTILVFQTLRRSASYGFSKPTREMLFSVFTAEQKYKLKNLIDVAGYRVADVLGSTSLIVLSLFRTSAAALCFIAAGSGALWLVYNQFLGRAFTRQLRDSSPTATATTTAGSD
jgi:AAA family ATP:ADP antiporter